MENFGKNWKNGKFWKKLEKLRNWQKFCLKKSETIRWSIFGVAGMGSEITRKFSEK